MHPLSVFKLSALIQLLIAAFMAVPTVIAIYYKERVALLSFAFTILLIILISTLTLIITRKEKVNIKAKDSYLLVTLTWLLATAFGSIPLFMTKTLDSYAMCFFEIMSGFTTTGATALTVIEDKFRSILFWRNMTNWLGGMGIVVLFVAVLPFLGVKGSSLVSAESVGPTKDKLTPKIQQTAFSLWAIYVGLSLIQTLLLLVKLPLFDALTVTFGTMGAAGFATTNNSIGSYNSAYVDIVVTIFMIAAGMNFAIFFRILRGKIKQSLHDSEMRFYLSIITVIALLIAVNLTVNGVFNGFFTAMRYSFFQVASIITTTGFNTTDYNMWPTFSKALLLLLFFIGGCAGSTSGGIKVVRVSTMMALAKNTIKKRLHPNAITPLTMGGNIIAEDTILSIAGFIGAYITTGLIGTVLFALSGEDIETCFTASFLLLGNIGTGMGAVGPKGNFSIFSDTLLSVGSFLMLAGRLELFTVYALFTRSFWKK